MKKVKFFPIIVVLVIAVIIIGLWTGKEDTVSDVTTVTQPPIEETTPPKEDISEVASTSTPSNIPEKSDDYYMEKVLWEDLDGNGVQEYLTIENGDNHEYGRLTFYFNDKPVYQYEEELNILNVVSKEYIDLDNDDKKEIFVSFVPDVNSAGLMEWFVLKKVDDGWKLMNDMSIHEFPISVTKGVEDFELVIACEGLNKEITYDATDYYDWANREDEEFYNAFINGNYKEGDNVGHISAYGIWNIEVTRWGGQDCLVAEHGLQGPGGKDDLYGTAYVYFKFNSKSEMKLLHIDFKRTVIPSLGVKSGETGGYNRYDGHLYLECENGRIYGFILDDDTELVYEDTSIFDFYAENYPPTVNYDERSVFGNSFEVTIESGEVMEVPEVNRKTIIYAWYHADKITVIDTHTECMGLAAKPVIYLYPEEDTDVEVQLDYSGNLTCTYPKYNNGWKVTAQPDGTLTDTSGQIYNYLYWEGFDNTTYDFSEGFCVTGEDTAAFLEDALDKLGLTRREANEFIVYWLPLMESNPYNLISFQFDTYTENAELMISPQPDTLLRVFMAWKPLEEKVEIEPQELVTTERRGFTVVEWGGTKVH